MISVSKQDFTKQQHEKAYCFPPLKQLIPVCASVMGDSHTICFKGILSIKLQHSQSPSCHQAFLLVGYFDIWLCRFAISDCT